MLTSAASHRAFDAGAVGDSADRGHVDRKLRAVLGGNAEAADREVALGHGVDLSVRAIQRRKDQRPATQALGLAHGRDGDVDTLAGLGEGRQIGGDQHRSRILQAGRNPRRQLHAHPARNPAHGLRQVFEVVVARAGKADDHAVAGQLVGAHALEGAQVAHTLGVGGQGQEGEKEEDRGAQHGLHLKTV